MRFLSFKLGTPMSYTDHDYSVVSERLGLATLDSVFMYNDFSLLFSILHGNINCRELIDMFAYRDLSYSLRDHRVLREYRVRDQSLFHSPVHRLRRLWNGLSGDISNVDDFLNFKRSVRLKYFCY